MQRERERERERETVSKNRSSSSPTTIDWAPVRRPTLHWSRWSQHRPDQAKIDSNATCSRLRRVISPSPLPRDLASRSNPVASLSSFFSQFDRIWWIFGFCFFCVSVWPNLMNFFSWVLFLLCFCIEKLYYIFFWQLRKCEQQVENVFSIVFSRTQPNTRKYFLKHFLKGNQILENIFLSRK